MKYFEKFPEVVYGEYLIKNILTSVKLDNLVKVTSEAYYPYTVDIFDEAWTIAADYYGDPNMSWLVYMANEIVDPVYDWFMNDTKFEQFIVKKYGTVAAAQANIKYYKEVIDGVDTGRKFSTNTRTYLPTEALATRFVDTSTWDSTLQAYSDYDWEVDKNESKRHIFLLNRDFAKEAEKQLKRLLKGV